MTRGVMPVSVVLPVAAMVLAMAAVLFAHAPRNRGLGLQSGLPDR